MKNTTMLFEQDKSKIISETFSAESEIVFSYGDALDILRACPSGFVKLIITSPPYNIGKEYEMQTNLEKYLNELEPVLEQVVRVLASDGSLCWQVGNYVEDKEVFPLDMFFYPLFKRMG